MLYITSIERRAIRQGLLEGIELGLELKFGNEGLQLLPEVTQIEDLEILKTVRDAIRRVTTLQELRTVLFINLTPRMPYVTSIERRAEERGRLIGAIEFGLELKFGNEGLQLLPEISQIEDPKVLKSIRDAIKRAMPLQELRTIYQ